MLEIKELKRVFTGQWANKNRRVYVISRSNVLDIEEEHCFVASL